MTTDSRVDRLDELVDEAARAMTAADPSDALSRHVLEAIEPRRRRTNRGWLVVPAGAMAAAALLIALQVAPEAPATLPDVSMAESPVSARGTASDLTAPGPIHIAAADPTPVGRRLRPARPVSSVEQAWLARAVPALDQPPTLEVPAIQPDRMAIPLMTVEPLATAPLTLPPIDPSTGDHR